MSTEHVVSKWYGDSEKRIAEIWNACDKMGGAVIFFDEVDALGNSRDKVCRCCLLALLPPYWSRHVNQC